MALEEASAPPSTRDLKGAVEEVLTLGKPGKWYFITSYENLASARDAAHKLGIRYPDLRIRADKGLVLAMKKETG
ncbi:MAG: hypothetical protein DRQ43_10020 [Gammaproteobacteria bacterium]|nr:MAG: hypothetical protein DRQ43_10020 [Gammaproteobacteria bacterium]